MIAINTTDILMMGWLGPQELAAGALGMNIYVPIFLFGLGIASVVAPMVSQALGARDFRGVRRTVRQGFWLTLLFGAIFTAAIWRSEEHTSELQSLMRISYAVFCLKKKTQKKNKHNTQTESYIQ